MFRVQIRAIANQDIKEAATWYNKKQEGLGKRFTGQVRQRIAILKQQPLSSAIRYDEVRTAVLGVFPFIIHYVVDESEQLITILALLHTSRDPNIWKTSNE